MVDAKYACLVQIGEFIGRYLTQYAGCIDGVDCVLLHVYMYVMDMVLRFSAK